MLASKREDNLCLRFVNIAHANVHHELGVADEFGCPMSVIRDVKIVEDPSDLLRARSIEAWEQWQIWAAETNAALPNWNLFTPMNHVRWLAHLMLFSIEDDRVSDATVVLTGQNVARHLGTDSINSKIGDVVSPANVEHLVDCLKFCMTQQRPAYMIKSMEWQDRDHVIYDSLMLPFQKDERNTRILSLLCFDIKPEEVMNDL